MNEATLEARLNAELQRIFPTLGRLKVSHQDIFTLHFGRKLLTINGKENDKAFGRYDVLVGIEDKPLILFELKRPGIDLLPEDIDQGISYGRLLDPMPPLLIISNGQDTEFYTTCDKKPWVPNSRDENALMALVEHALSAAAAEKDEAVRLLLGQQPKIWTNIIRQFTSNKLIAKEGDLKDLTYPLAKAFSLPRKIVSRIADLSRAGEQLIALIGPPLSGKTNVIAQLCSGEFNDLVPLYVDGTSLTYGILQHLANIFAHELFHASTTTEIRNWLLNGLRNPVDGRLLVIIDGWTSNISAQIRADVEEIIDICKGQAVSIVIALDESSFSSLVSVPGRPTITELGHKLVKVPLGPLDDDEFGWDREYFSEKQNALFYPGSEHNEEYRYPRILRVVAAQFPTDRTLKGDTVALIPSVTSIDFLYVTWHEFASDPTLREDFRKLAKAFLSDKPSRDSDAKLALLAHGRGYITSETAERELGTDRLNRLLAQGHAQKITYGSSNVLIAPKVPELLSSAASHVLAEETVVLFKEGQKDAAYQCIVKNSSSFPYGDTVGAMAVIEAAKRDDALLTFIVGSLIEDQPKFGKGSKSFEGLLDVPAVGVLRIHSKIYLGGKLISNIHPWLILSHLANVPIATKDGSRDIQLEMFYQVGSYPDVLRKPDSISNKIMKGFHVHDISGVGALLCHQTGIVEPIMQAILNGFYTMPREMIRLCKRALEENRWALWWRLSWAAKMTETCSDPKVAETSKEAIALLPAKGHALKQMLDDSFRHQTLPDLGKKKIGRNDPCPCGSGRKYKKCCMIH